MSVSGTRPYELAPPLPVLEISINRTTSFPRCAHYSEERTTHNLASLTAVRSRPAEPASADGSPGRSPRSNYLRTTDNSRPLSRGTVTDSSVGSFCRARE